MPRFRRVWDCVFLRCVRVAGIFGSIYVAKITSQFRVGCSQAMPSSSCQEMHGDAFNFPSFFYSSCAPLDAHLFIS